MSSVRQHQNTPLFPAWGWCMLLLTFLIFALPLFVCAPVTSDTSLFDVQAMTALKGGVLYRDVIEPNLPGVVWLHMAVRSIIGWSSEAMRGFDLLVLGVTVLLLASVSSAGWGRTRGLSGGLVFSLTLFYMTRNEWCHCQRDSWMLLPVASALWLRSERSSGDLPVRLAAVVEGVFWGIAFWIKPHVAVPAVSIMLVERARFKTWKAWASDVLLIVIGGLLAALPGVIWLMVSGAWPHFWEMMLDWNPDYLEAGRQRRSVDRLTMMFSRFYPWWLLHLLAIPLASHAIWNFLRNADVLPAVRIRALLAITYLAWLGQAFILQHAMDYIHVPEIMLAIVVVATHPWRLDASVRKIAVVVGLLVFGVSSPMLYHGRPQVWARCFSEGSSAEIRSVLAQGNFPDWVHLERVRSFLQRQRVRDHDLTCMNVHSVHLHQELRVLPATRYWTVLTPLTMFPKRFDEIMATVAESRQRFVVVEEHEMSQEGQIRPKLFPRQFPLAFESGSYKVYAVPSDDSPKVAVRE